MSLPAESVECEVHLIPQQAPVLAMWIGKGMEHMDSRASPWVFPWDFDPFDPMILRFHAADPMGATGNKCPSGHDLRRFCFRHDN